MNLNNDGPFCTYLTVYSGNKLPIFYIGVGEQPEHLVKFDKYEFVTNLLDEIFTENEA